MLIMLHHDCAYNPTPAQLGITPGKKNQPSQKSVLNQAAHIAFLEENPLEKVSEADLDLVSSCSSIFHIQGPVVQSGVSLTSSLVFKMLSVLVSTVSNSQ